MRWTGRRVRVCVIATALAAAAAAPASATISLSAPSLLTIDTPPLEMNGIAVGDLNGDGIPDLAFVSGNPAANSGVLTVMLGNGAGGFGAPLEIPIGTSTTQLYGVAIGQLLPGGLPDIVVTDNKNGKVWVVPNTTTAGASTLSFGTAVPFSVGTSPWDVAIGDVNGDGRNDIIVTNNGSNNVSVLLNTATSGTTPSFAAQQNFAVGSSPIGVAVADLNRDGRPDIVTADQGGTGVSVLMNTTAQDATTATFATHEDIATGTFPYAVAVGDLNRDGIPDIAVANNGDDNVSVLMGDGDGQFSAPQDHTAGTGPDAVAIGDLNGDGHADIVVANYGSENISVLAGNGLGGFAPATDFGLGGVAEQPVGVAVADLNGDGADDVVTVNATTQNASVLLDDGIISSPGALSFGSQTTGQPGPVLWLEVTDTGGAPLTFTDVSRAGTSGTDSSDFTIPAGDDQCTGQTVAPGGICWIGVQFTPGGAGARTATLHFAAANVDLPAPAVALSGTGVAPGTGPRGTTGATGPTGPPGAAGKVELVVCTKKTVIVRRRRKQVETCTTKTVSKPVKFTVSFRNARATLERGRRVIASGEVHDGELLLDAPHALRAGTYTLVLRSGRRSVRMRLTIR